MAKFLLFQIALCLAIVLFSAESVDALSKEERNRRNVIKFYKLAFQDNKPREAADKYLGRTYTQHNPTVPDGADAFVGFVSFVFNTTPTFRAEIQRSISAGNYVWLHSKFLWPGYVPSGQLAVVDIYRLNKKGKIVEHWDAIQEVPLKTANDNTMF